jgi:hypothetical protein
MAAQGDFIANVQNCLRDYAIMVNGASSQPSFSGGTVGALIGGGFVAGPIHGLLSKTPGAIANSAVSLQAPLVTIQFAEDPARDIATCSFSKKQVTVNLGTHHMGNIPVYLIPYEGGKGRGVKLPAHGADAFPVAYAMTATQNGCTVEVSGTQASPYASHTNVRDVVNPAAALQWAAREGKINSRLGKLINRFAQEEINTGGNALLPTQNRTQFGFYDQNAVGMGPTMVNYNNRMTQVANQNLGQRRFQRVENTIGHTNMECTLTPECINECNNRAFPPQALVVGRRDAGGWVFHYNLWRPLELYVDQVTKLGRLVVKRTHLRNTNGTRKKFHPTVGLDYGQLWPNYVPQPIQLGF